MGSMNNIKPRPGLHQDDDKTTEDDLKDKRKTKKRSEKEEIGFKELNVKLENFKNAASDDSEKIEKEELAKKEVSNKEGSTRKEPKNENPQSWSTIPISAILILSVAIVFYWYVYSCKKQDEQLEFINLAKFTVKMKAISQRMKETKISHSPFMKVNRTLISFLKEDEHTKPAVILLLGCNTDVLACCFMWDIVDSLSATSELTANSNIIKAKDLISKTGNEGKAFIEETIKKQIESNGSNVIIMENIDKFPVNVLSKVQVYYDNDHAPHKNAIFILTATTTTCTSHKDKPVDIATQHFDEVWKGYETEHRHALMGRMLSTVALLQLSDFENGNCSQETYKKCGND